MAECLNRRLNKWCLLKLTVSHLTSNIAAPTATQTDCQAVVLPVSIYANILETVRRSATRLAPQDVNAYKRNA